MREKLKNNFVLDQRVWPLDDSGNSHHLTFFLRAQKKEEANEPNVENKQEKSQ